MRFTTALVTLAVTLSASVPALADCVPGTGLCAAVGAGVPGVQANGQVVIGIPPFFGPAPAPPPQPAPPPPAPAYAPPPPVAYPAYPPVYGYAPPPPRPMYAPPAYWGSRVGLDLHIDGSAGFGGNVNHNAYGLGGAGVALKLRGTPYLSLELGLDVLGGHDWNADSRTEVAGHVGGVLTFNPRSRAQIYGVAGLLIDHAAASPDSSGSSTSDLTYNHVGGYGGLGLEVFITRHFSIHGDARGFVRQNVGGSPGPEFTNPTTGQTTNTSGGIVGQGGLTLYF